MDKETRRVFQLTRFVHATTQQTSFRRSELPGTYLAVLWHRDAAHGRKYLCGAISARSRS